MDLGKIGNSLVAAGLPILGSVLGGPAGGVLGSSLAAALGVKGKDIKQVLANPNEIQMNTLKRYELEHEEELKKLQIMSDNLKDVNITYRKEIASKDKYVRRMRPTFGYLLALILLVLTLTGTYSVVYDPSALSSFVQLVNAMTVPLTTAMAVLGIVVHGRTKEKLSLNDPPKQGFLSKLFPTGKG